MTDYFNDSVPTGAAPTSVPQVWGSSTAQGWSQPTWGQHAAPRRSSASTVLIVIGCVIGTIVVIGILAAIAIPVFLDQRAKGRAAAVHVSIPATAAGMARLHTAQALSIERTLLSVSTPGTHYAGVYGKGTQVIASVSISTHPMRPADRRGFLDNAEAGVANGAAPGEVGSFVAADPGRLGGDLECAAVSDVGVMCFFADDGAYGLVTVFKRYDAGVVTARSVREAVERHS